MNLGIRHSFWESQNSMTSCSWNALQVRTKWVTNALTSKSLAGKASSSRLAFPQEQAGSSEFSRNPSFMYETDNAYRVLVKVK